MSKRTCSADGCTRPSRKRGMCETHYKRWLRNSDIIGPPRPRRDSKAVPPPLEREPFTASILPVPPGHGVYIASSAGVVVYVGYSSNIQARLGQHAMTSEWWHIVTAIDVQWVGTSGRDRGQALSLERELIDEHQPNYNKSLRNPESLEFQRMIDGGLLCERCNTAPATRLVHPKTFMCEACCSGKGADLKTLWRHRAHA